MKFPKDEYTIGKITVVLSLIFSVIAPLSFAANHSNWCVSEAGRQAQRAIMSIASIVFIVLFLVCFLKSILVIVSLMRKKREEWKKLAPWLLFSLCVFLPIYYLSIMEGSSPEVCTLPDGMVCTKMYIHSETDKVLLAIINRYPEPITITGISCTKKTSQMEKCDASRCPDYTEGGVSLATGKASDFKLTCNDENGEPMKFEQADGFCGNINIEYYLQSEGPGKSRVANGKIMTRAA